MDEATWDAVDTQKHLQSEGSAAVQVEAASLTPVERQVSDAMQRSLRRWWDSQEGGAMRAARAALPIAAIHDELLAALAEQDVVLVCGDTGCGKTTQVRRVCSGEKGGGEKGGGAVLLLRRIFCCVCVSF